MTFLHLADLHIGKSVNGFSMLEEQRHAFAQIIAYIQQRRPDAVVIAGDVYDRAAPGVEAVRLFDDFLTELAAQDVAVLLIAGNHDSPERLSYAGRLLAERNIHLCGAFDGTLRSVAFEDGHGPLRFWLLPFIKPASVRGLFEGREIESYDDALAAALGSATIDPGIRNVLVSHQFYVKPGVAPQRSDSELSPVGGLDAMDADLLSGFDCVALGHLHGAQRVGGGCVRYAGSPVKYSFSEWRQRKSVTLVELGAKGDVAATALPLTPLHDMREIKGPLERLVSAEVAWQADREDYLRVVLTDEEEVIDAMGKLRGVYPNVMALAYENSRSCVDIAAIATDAENVEALSPYELFSNFFLEASGAAMTREQAALARELLETEAAL